MRKGIPSKRELLDKLAEIGWDDPQLRRLNMKLLQRMIYELAPILVPQIMPWDKNYLKRSKPRK